MKYVHFDLASVDPQWQAKAEAAAARAAGKPDDKSRQAYIRSKSALWSELKPALEAASDGKCWYSEAREKVSYWEVDHYRPKALYPWLAFHWANFRLCGGKPNRKKGDEFPLEDEVHRATPDSPDTGNERPLLLDPVVWNDPTLLTFKADGEPTPAVPESAICVRRIRETVSTFQLDSELLCESRRAKWRACEAKLKKLRDIVEAARHRGNADAADFSRELCRDIAGLFEERAEFTSTAQACSAELQAQALVELARNVARRFPV